MKVHYWLFLYFGSFFIFSETAFAQTGNPKPDVYAVVIGISGYLENDIRQLQFANRDAEIFTQFLKSKSGGSVPAENIRLLTDSNATTAAVYNAIYWLKQSVKKDDVVYFYFSGHGDLENLTMYHDAYLICYNSPPVNYIGMALSVEYLNKIANTLSAETDAKVILITDACHSGKITDAQYKVNRLVGEKLMATNEKEIRIASCTFDQLSNEKEEWGGGRGVFSYYLVNGLKGLADKSGDGTVTVGEIQSYLENALKTDRVMKQENLVQTPVFKGNAGYSLARVDTEELNKTRQTAVADLVPDEVINISVAPAEDDAMNVPADEYFISWLKKQSLEDLTLDLQLDKIPADKIAVVLINHIKDSLQSEAGINKLNELQKNLQRNTEMLNRFNEMLVIEFDNKAQAVINHYLEGDEAELERRRYYNVASSGYDVYPKMLTVALKLTQPDNYFYNILQVKLHYFSGVVHRLNLPTTPDIDSLLELAFAEQRKALALETRAAYIYNELGILYMAKGENADAEENFKTATTFAPDWALPWANLCYLFATSNRTQMGYEACQIADSLQSGLPCTSTNFGLVYENSGDFLNAEEFYRNSIALNSRHYLPFRRLGYVYMNTARYALADSFFNEADLRKQEMHSLNERIDLITNAQNVILKDKDFKPCAIDISKISSDDLMAFFYLAMEAMEDYRQNFADAEKMLKKVIAIDRHNPLAYHYLGKIYYKQSKWEEAELMFKYAMQNNMDLKTFGKYCDSLVKLARYPYVHNCFEELFRSHFYQKVTDYYLMALVYDKWGQFQNAEAMYKVIIQLKPEKIERHIFLWKLLERLGRYAEVEKLIINFAVIDKERSDLELNAFYRRMIEESPENNTDWCYRLGMLLFSRSAGDSIPTYLDSIIWFPKLNKEMFVDFDVQDLIDNSSDYSLDADKSDFVYYYNRKKRTINIPDSQNALTSDGLGFVNLAGEIDMPRIDGIKYLLKAAAAITEKKILADIYLKIADIYFWAGSKKQAYPYYAKSLDIDPANSNTRLQVVDVYTSIYKNKAALEQLNYLYDSSQINFPKRLLFAQMAMFAGQYEKSKKLLNEARTIHPYNLPEFADLSGRLYLLSNNPDSAISYYKNYIKTNPDDANAYYTLSRLYAGINNKAEALNWLEQSIKHGFNYAYVLEADPSMDNLRGTARWKAMVTNKLLRKKKQTGIFISDY